MNIRHCFSTPLLIVPVLCLTLAGCGDAGLPRAGITGRVTIGGAPLKAGRILFLPQSPIEGPAVSARIIEGAYKLLDTEGPMVGSNRVEVEADLPLEFAIDDEAAFAKTKGRLPRQPVPPKFNRQSQLVVQVQGQGDNLFDVNIPATVLARGSASR